jgi:hypothetical protein
MELSGQLHAQATYPRLKSPWYPLGTRLRVTHSRSGQCGEEIFCSCREMKRGRIPRRPLLYRLNYPDSLIYTGILTNNTTQTTNSTRMKVAPLSNKQMKWPDPHCVLLGSDTVNSGRWLPTFRTNILLPSSRQNTGSEKHIPPKRW